MMLTATASTFTFGQWNTSQKKNRNKDQNEYLEGRTFASQYLEKWMLFQH
jgi:hypothetical protein